MNIIHSLGEFASQAQETPHSTGQQWAGKYTIHRLFSVIFTMKSVTISIAGAKS
jgi:hypothetical protein